MTLIRDGVSRSPFLGPRSPRDFSWSLPSPARSGASTSAVWSGKLASPVRTTGCGLRRARSICTFPKCGVISGSGKEQSEAETYPRLKKQLNNPDFLHYITDHYKVSFRERPEMVAVDVVWAIGMPRNVSREAITRAAKSVAEKGKKRICDYFAWFCKRLSCC